MKTRSAMAFALTVWSSVVVAACVAGAFADGWVQKGLSVVVLLYAVGMVRSLLEAI
jgi:predicted neutral ceramidase superfamily lipid hydrolase